MIPKRGGVPRGGLRRTVAVLLSASIVGSVHAEQTRIVDLPTVRTVAVAPAEGGMLPLDRVPYPVRILDPREAAASEDLASALDRLVPGISLNAAQGNPLQPDLQYRGFTGSPLLGLPQGIAVYLDGVRINEVFGDTVNWDLLPLAAIGRTEVMSGANPVFGLNTLGGAVVLHGRNGFDDPGSELGVEIGSYGRETEHAQLAGQHGDIAGLLYLDHLYEQGWRDQSPTHARRLYGTAGWHGERGSVDLSLLHADTELTGNGLQSIQALGRDYDSIFTAPDQTDNTLTQLTLRGSFRPSEDVLLSANLHHRRVDTRSFNGDAVDAEACEDDAAVLCAEDDGEQQVLVDQNGNAVSADYDAVNNIGERRQRSDGATLQAVFSQPLGSRDNQLVLGTEANDGSVGYRSRVEMAQLQDNRSTTRGSGITLPDDAVDLRATARTWSLYATDTLALTPALSLTLSARYNRTRVRIADRSGKDPDLNGRHAFSRLNPAIGLTWSRSPILAAYLGYSESTRVPTPVELSCADEDAPCKLPNQFLADPPLKQVVARSWEAGLRGRRGSALHWQAGVFRTVAADDILFQSTGGATSNEGFFANVADTRRQGVELVVDGRLGGERLQWNASYVWLDARYRDGFVVASVHHPLADADGLIEVERGDHIPGLPRHQFKAGLDYSIAPQISVGVSARYRSAVYLRGDEANLLSPLSGYTVFDASARWDITPRLRFTARIENLTDKRYASFGALGEPDEVFAGDDDPRFLGPGAPRGGWLGVRYRFQ